MKNAILISSAVATIAMIVFINSGLKKINQSQEEAMEPVGEWMNDITEQQENIIAAEAEKAAAKVRFSERMRDLSQKQASIATALTKAFQANGEQTDSAPLLNTLIQKQTLIIHEFKRFNIDLNQHLQGIADYRHIQVRDAMRDSRALTHLQDIKTKLSQNHAHQAAELSKTWAASMAAWADLLATMQVEE